MWILPLQGFYQVRKLKTYSSEHILETSVTMIFKNNQDKDLEGELVFPLEDGNFSDL